jgi:putative tryptophan/tyrosine transport system substrate-binding protein
MKRRKFITLIGGAGLGWPLAAYAQQAAATPTIGVLVALAETDPEAKLRVAALEEGLETLGWKDGRNVRIEYRWGDNAERLRSSATQLVERVKPSLFFAGNAAAVVALKQSNATSPIIFVQVPDPVAAGFVATLSRPGANITGFALYEYAIAGKWVELIKQIEPRTVHIGVIYETVNSGQGHLPAIETALSPGMRSVPYPVRNRTDIEQAIGKLAALPNSALVVAGGPLTALYRDLIVSLATQQGLPTGFPYRYFAAAGGLFAYGPDTVDQYRTAATYVDRVLKGENPADLPVQFPTKYSLVINLKTATVLRVSVPQSLLATADEVIE